MLVRLLAPPDREKISLLRFLLHDKVDEVVR